MARSAWEDKHMLEALHLMDNEGQTAAQVAKIMSAKMGATVTRNSILGIVHRVKKDTDKVDASPHLNGTMPQRWWA